MGREPLNPAEWMSIQDDAVRYLNKTQGAPSIKKDPFQGFTPKIVGKEEEKIGIEELLKGPVRSSGPKGDRIWDFSEKRGEVIPFPKKPKRGIEELIENEEIFVGKAPKTQKSTLDAKKERDLLLRDADEDILRIKKENKDAIRRFKEKNPDKFYAGGIAPLVGEPSYSADFYDDRIPYAGGLLVKGGRWFLNNLRKALKDIESNQGFKNLTPERKEGLTSEIKNLIKSIEGGGPLPDEMIQTIRHDPKFAEISKTRSTDPDLYEFEDVILNYNKDVDRMKDISQKIELEDFDVTGQTKHADGGRIGYAGGGIFKLLKMLKSKPKPKSNKLSEQDVVALKKKHGLDPESLKKDDEAFKLRLQQILAKHSTKHAYGGRVSYAGGGQAGLPAITQGIETPQTNMQGPQMPAPAPQPAGISGANFGQNQRDLMQQKMEQNPWMQNQMKQGIGGMQKPQYGGQFRMPFGIGGLTRRAFLKMMAAGAALPFMPKALTKLAPKAVPKVVETVASSNASGMPLWFPKLVERVIKEGDDVTRKAGSEAMERQTVHRATLPSGTPVEVTSDLTKGDVIVDIGMGKHGWKDGWHGQPTRLILKKGEWIEPTKKGKKGIKTKDEFEIEEAEFTGGHPENIKYEDVTIEQYGNHGSDFTEVEKYATGKTTKGSKAKRQAWEPDWDDSLPDYEDYASGGLARLLGE